MLGKAAIIIPLESEGFRIGQGWGSKPAPPEAMATPFPTQTDQAQGLSSFSHS